MAPSFVMTNESVTGEMTPPLVLQKHTQNFRPSASITLSTDGSE
jgi:hypothetical protein